MATSPDMTVAVTIRPARDDEIDALTALCRQSKQHWGYDEAFMIKAEAALAIDSARVSEGLVIVAEQAGRPVGVAGINPFSAAEIAGDHLLRKGDVDLSHLFIAPAAMGRGIGRSLFAAAVERARQVVGRRLVILSDPNARAFYEAMGARFLTMAPSDAIPGRNLPLLALDL
ncbi:MAG: GNAT family N-acetyltransferase [Azospirillaceae bacterium]